MSAHRLATRAGVAIALLAAATATTAAGCGTDAATHTNVVFTRPVAPGETTYFSFPVKSGQILLSESFGAHALLFGLGTVQFFRFTHAAILVVENGEPFVYEFSGEFKPTLATTPPETIRGGMRRSRFLEYVRGHVYVEVLDPPAGVDPARMIAKIADIKKQAPDFDPYWHYGDPSRLFCTEFVAEVLLASGGRVPALVPVTRNRSLRTLLDWFGLRDEIALPAGLFLDPSRKVAALSIWGNTTAVDAFFAAKAEIHRRFTPDQNVGDLFVMKGHEIELRPHVAAFLDRAPHLFDGWKRTPTPAEIARAVDALATASFGAFPAGGSLPPSPPVPAPRVSMSRRRQLRGGGTRSTSARTGTTSTSSPAGASSANG